MTDLPIKIFVATHASVFYKLPLGYEYIRVGDQNFSCTYLDSVGNNISNLNPYYCELTGIYWIWKNYLDKNSIVGLNHYRRVMADDSHWQVFSKTPIAINKVKAKLINFDLLLPKRLYHKLSLYDLYDKSHQINDLVLMLESLEQIHHVAFSESLNFLKNTHFGYYGNMMICKKSLFDDYCAWAFPVLDKVFKQIDFIDRTKSESRVIGYLSERLFNIWLKIHPDLKIKELPIIRLDKSHIFNWNNYRKSLRGKLE